MLVRRICDFTNVCSIRKVCNGLYAVIGGRGQEGTLPPEIIYP